MGADFSEEIVKDFCICGEIGLRKRTEQEEKRGAERKEEQGNQNLIRFRVDISPRITQCRARIIRLFSARRIGVFTVSLSRRLRLNFGVFWGLRFLLPRLFCS